jgi:hypothetical protein
MHGRALSRARCKLSRERRTAAALPLAALEAGGEPAHG